LETEIDKLVSFYSSEKANRISHDAKMIFFYKKCKIICVYEKKAVILRAFFGFAPKM